MNVPLFEKTKRHAALDGVVESRPHRPALRARDRENETRNFEKSIGFLIFVVMLGVVVVEYFFAPFCIETLPVIPPQA